MEFTIVPRGPFSLKELAEFGFGSRHSRTFDGVMRMAFCVDGAFTRTVGVEVRQDGTGVHVRVRGSEERAASAHVVQRQVARILSLDHDASGFVEIGQRDAVIGRLQAVAPGLRPPQFVSPYEAAAWGVISARWSSRQGQGWWRRFSETHGTARHTSWRVRR
ncbi:MAG: hypothetical protein V9G08_08685 [Dermatophilaceae bacterium]